ncbi:S41 family peptidase [Romboutsia hominis]|uniref:S41 family peptidase n=1 Tax=Romboutsia hominis TaxID=1507512 RepID=UPI000AA10A65|nr:S41 family peptidase [Romboutsia hominis]
MRKIIKLIVIIFLLGLSIGCSSNDKLKELTKEEKVEDFNYYINTMKENYGNFDVFYNKYNTEYLDLYDVFKEEIEDSNSNEEFYNKMNALINLLGDGHTNLISPDSIDWYINLYKGSYQGNVLNDKDLIDKNKKWKNYIGENNNLQSLNKKINEKISKNYKGNIETKIIDDEIAYIKINSFGEFTNEDINKINELYKDINNYKDYIIDIRGNGGGNSKLWIDHIVSPIVNNTYESTTYALHKDGKITKEYYEARGNNLKDINEFPKKDMLKKVRNIEDYKYYTEYKLKFSNESIFDGIKNKEGYNGNIYLLVDKGVFSSAEGLAIFCKDSGWAKVVGNENSGGDGVGIDPIVFKLPNSGLVVRSTAEKGLNADGSSNLENGTSLDLYMNSLDDLIDYIKNDN